LIAFTTGVVFAQKTLNWEQVKDEFRVSNPTLQAGAASVQESRAQEITAHLRPNPEFTMATDGTQLAPANGVWTPFAGTQYSTNFSYLKERQHKRELRYESAQQATGVAQSQQSDLERNLLFNLRNAFIQILQSQATLTVTRESLAYYDRVLEVSADRLKGGDIARVDLTRLQLQRIQFVTDVQTADVNLRTAKIQLLALLNDRTPVDQFNVTGRYDFSEPLTSMDELHRVALASRPDLAAAIQAIDKAKTDYRLAVANGSTDPTLSGWYTHNPSFNNPNDANTIGASVSIPLRIFDRNQGERARTQIEIGRTERLRDASSAQVYSDVDSAFVTLNNTLMLLRPYKATYLGQAAEVRDTISFSYQRGGASLLDFLNAQNDYRSIQLNYQNLIGAYLTAANQLNFAVGREVIP
jgi:cobalt-zinc-cadmium efflux system outer membrane protein